MAFFKGEILPWVDGGEELRRGVRPSGASVGEEVGKWMERGFTSLGWRLL